MPVELKGSHIDFLVDTGAARTVIAYTTYTSLCSLFGPLRACTTPIRGPDNRLLDIRGETDLAPFSIGKRTCAVSVLIMADVQPGGLLGMDILLRLGVILNLEDLTYTVSQNPLSPAQIKDRNVRALQIRGNSIDNRILPTACPQHEPLPQRPPRAKPSPDLPPYSDTPDAYPPHDPWSPLDSPCTHDVITLPPTSHVIDSDEPPSVEANCPPTHSPVKSRSPKPSKPAPYVAPWRRTQSAKLASAAGLSRSDYEAFSRDLERKELMHTGNRPRPSPYSTKTPDGPTTTPTLININHIKDSSFILKDEISIPANSYTMLPVPIPPLPQNMFAVEQELDLPEGIRVPPALIKMCHNVVPISNHTDDDVTLPKYTRICNITPVDLTTTTVDEGSVPWDTSPPPTYPNPLPPIDDNLAPPQADSLHNLCDSFSDIFAKSDSDTGLTDMAEHHIETTGAPIRQPFRRQPPGNRQEERRQVAEMERKGLIKPSNSPWSSPTVLVKKKDGSLRFCVDYRKLNNVTIKDAHPLPRIDDTLESLYGAKFFSVLDLQQGYFQVPVAEQDMEKTAFSTSSGELFEFTVMPMGVSNGPATFARLMEKVLNGINWVHCLSYLDDIIIFSSTFEEHLSRLEEVFTRIRLAGLKLKPSKCTLAQPQVDFLGHVVSEHGISVNPKKTAAIDKLAPPTKVKEVRHFLGMTSYYRRYVKDFSTIAKPLYKLLEHDHKFVWDDACDAAFRELKRRLTSAPIMAYPCFELPFTLHTDASDYGLGAVLSQKQDNKERVIAYASRTLVAAEKNYSATKKELLGIVWAVRYFRPYLTGNKFDIFTDHYSLQWLQKMEHGSATFQRWRDDLAQYNFEVKYKPGKNNGNADGLSRLPIEDCQLNHLFLTRPDPLHNTADDTPHTAGEAEQEELRLLENASHNISWPDFLPKAWKGSLSMVKGSCFNSAGMIVLGPLSGSRVMKKIHHGPGGHMGVRRLLHIFQGRFWMPHARKVASAVVAECTSCQLGKDYGPPRKFTGSTGALKPWQIVAVDIMGPLPKSYSNEYIITFNDCFTRFVVAIPSSNHRTSTIAKIMMTHVISAYGIPEVVLSDRGSEFTSELWDELSRIHGYHLQHTSPYHPATNGICERAHRTIGNAIRAALVQDPNLKWSDILPSLQLTLNASPCQSTNFSPHELLFGHSVRLPVQQHILSPDDNPLLSVPDNNYLKSLKSALETARLEVLKSTTINPPTINPYKVGQSVSVRVMPTPGKLQARWSGPFTITNVPNQFQITYYTANGRRRTIHTNDAKPYIPPTFRPSPEVPPAPSTPPQPLFPHPPLPARPYHTPPLLPPSNPYPLPPPLSPRPVPVYTPISSRPVSTQPAVPPPLTHCASNYSSPYSTPSLSRTPSARLSPRPVSSSSATISPPPGFAPLPQHSPLPLSPAPIPSSVEPAPLESLPRPTVPDKPMYVTRSGRIVRPPARYASTSFSPLRSRPIVYSVPMCPPITPVTPITNPGLSYQIDCPVAAPPVLTPDAPEMPSDALPMSEPYPVSPRSPVDPTAGATDSPSASPLALHDSPPETDSHLPTTEPVSPFVPVITPPEDHLPFPIIEDAADYTITTGDGTPVVSGGGGVTPLAGIEAPSDVPEPSQVCMTDSSQASVTGGELEPTPADPPQETARHEESQGNPSPDTSLATEGATVEAAPPPIMGRGDEGAPTDSQ